MAVENTTQQDVPDAGRIQTWVNAAIQQAGSDELMTNRATQMTVRIVETDEMTELNQQYRQKTGPTNVLSFPFESPPGMPTDLMEPTLGDVVVCAAVVIREAAVQGKTLTAHWAHMIVHGTLHLLGYDHIQNNDAQKMESLEIIVLAELGYENPYSV
ncbi:MAG: rRNA maturation RNase YbeY [Gammaproteobacteria bacterium]|nr:rRNA maturation RNase YbeY [Gammaproteobacteria bacterium]